MVGFRQDDLPNMYDSLLNKQTIFLKIMAFLKICSLYLLLFMYICPVKAGWVIGVPSPQKDELDPELEQLEDIVRAFKRSDTKLLLLTRECHQLFKSTPVTLITGEWNLSNAVQMQGVPCHLCAGFPIEGLKEAAAITKPVDWEQVLEEIQSDTKQKAIVVEATLTAQRSAPPWLMFVTGTKRFMIAEGRGVMRAGNDVRPFLWTIHFYFQTLGPRPSGDDEGLFALPSIYLDFFGEDNFGQDLFDAIADRLLDCANLSFEEGTPTLQNPESIMEVLLHYSEDEYEQIACLEGFVEAVKNCWEIGQTYKFSIMREQKEHLA